MVMDVLLAEIFGILVAKHLVEVLARESQLVRAAFHE